MDDIAIASAMKHTTPDLTVCSKFFVVVICNFRFKKHKVGAYIISNEVYIYCLWSACGV